MREDWTTRGPKKEKECWFSQPYQHPLDSTFISGTVDAAYMSYLPNLEFQWNGNIDVPVFSRRLQAIEVGAGSTADLPDYQRRKIDLDDDRWVYRTITFNGLE